MDRPSSDQISEDLANLKCSEGAQDESEEENQTDSEGEEENVDQSLDDVDPSSVLVRVQETSSECKETGLSDESSNADEVSANFEDSEADCDSEDDSDGGGWITPNNINQAKKQMNAEFEEEKEVKVACITTDFAMQVCTHIDCPINLENLTLVLCDTLNCYNKFNEDPNSDSNIIFLPFSECFEANRFECVIC